MREVFLDGASNTPIDKEVFLGMKPYLTHGFVGNSSSAHNFGIIAANAIDKARAQVANAVKADPTEVYFTSGATEGNNWVIQSVAKYQLMTGMKRPRVVCGATEHGSVLNTCKSLQDLGFDVVFIKPRLDGRITLTEAREYINKQTCLVCIMAVNNELGVSNTCDRIAQYASQRGAVTLIDCTQDISLGGGSVEVCNNYPHGDYFTFSAHKFYGPTGVGCLIMRKGSEIDPFIYGGAQEFGKRAGTSNTAGIVGMGIAIENLHNSDYNHLYTTLFSYLVDKIRGLGELNVIPDHTNIVSISFAKRINVENLAAMLATEGIAVSAGSACDATHSDIEGFNPSHVLSAIKLPENIIRNTIRISFTKYTTVNDIDRLVRALESIINDFGIKNI